MKKILHLKLIVALIMLMPVLSIAQTIVDFETLPVPDIGYFNGSSEHSGTIDATEKFEYSQNGANFRVYYTQADGYGYWNGTAYSTTTDLISADWNNYSAYSANGGGGYNGSSVYAFGYFFGSDTVTLDEKANFQEVYLTNSVWTYHYINGTDGVGTGTYQAGDYYKLIFKGLDENNNYTGDEVEFYLADFTNGNTTIIDDWTQVDLSALGGAKGIEITPQTTDEYTPLYYCFDNLTYSTVINVPEITEKTISVYPNPATDLITISEEVENVFIYDLSGRIISVSDKNIINISDLQTGTYIIKIKNNNAVKTSKFIKI